MVTGEDAAQNIADTLGVSIEDATQLMKDFQDTAKTDIESKINFLLTTKGDKLSIAIAEAGLGLRTFNVNAVFGKLPAGITDTSKDLGEVYHGGARQHGGKVYPGLAYLVGERGPEPFIPDQAGTILPNMSGIIPSIGELSQGIRGSNYPQSSTALASGGSQVVNINQYINDSQAAAMMSEEVNRIRQNRMNASMGVG